MDHLKLRNRRANLSFLQQKGQLVHLFKFELCAEEAVSTRESEQGAIHQVVMKLHRSVNLLLLDH